LQIESEENKMNTTIITTILRWEKELEIQQQASAKRRYSFGIEESASQPGKEKRHLLFTWRRPQPVHGCRPQPACECA